MRLSVGYIAVVNIYGVRFCQPPKAVADLQSALTHTHTQYVLTQDNNVTAVHKLFIRYDVDKPTVVPEHHSQVVLSPGADVDQNAGSTGGAEAEYQLFLSQVGLTGNTNT